MASESDRRKQLTDLQCRRAVATEKPLKLRDAQGLYLYITPSGHKGWRMKYRVGKTEKLLTFGAYPEMSLSAARDMRDDVRKLLREGIDPAQERKARAERLRRGMDPSTAFEAIARRWFALSSPQWKEKHSDDVLKSLEGSVFPAIGSMAIAEIRPSHIRELCQRVQARGAIETAHRIRQRISAVFTYAIAEELVEMDPAKSIGAALQSVVKRRQPAVVKIEDARAFLAAYEAEPAHPASKLASRLLALTAVRPGVIQRAEADEFEALDGNAPIWRIPAEKMKLEKVLSEDESMEFMVPLSRQAVATVKAAMQFARGRKYLFPSVRHPNRSMSDATLHKAYRTVKGFERRHVPHGWRATFSTIMNQRAADMNRPGDRAIIDLMLAHVQDGVEPLYNRAAYMEQRHQIAQDWADLLLDERFCHPLEFLPAKRR